MMSRNQRLSFLGIAAVIAVVAIVVLTAGGSDDTSTDDSANTSARQTATATATPSADDGQEQPTPTPTPTPTPKPQPPLLVAGKVTKLRFDEGETVRFRARSAETEEIHVHGYDRYVDLPAGKTVTESFKAGITGIFEIELHGSGEVIAELRVDPK
jgi:type V secretory pathway adhesin AidA